MMPHSTGLQSTRPDPVRTRSAAQTPAHLPQHVAIAQSCGCEDVGGFVTALEETVSFALKHGLRHLTLRVTAPGSNGHSEQGEALLAALADYVAQAAPRGVSFALLGSLDDNAPLARAIAAQSRAADDSLRVNLAVNYTGRAELAAALRQLATQVAAGRLRPEQIDASGLEQALLSAELPAVDLLIHTDGHRLGDFLLWKAAYAELFFSQTPWPRFRAADWEAALQDYAGRKRTFGALL